MDYPFLIADIGGTNARFALEISAGAFAGITTLQCADFPSIADAISAYLLMPEVVNLGSGRIRHAGIAIANPVEGDLVCMTNHHWTFSVAALQSRFDFQSLVVANDFKALAMAVPALNTEQRVQVGGGFPKSGAPVALIGAGTGLGMSGLIKTGQGWHALDSEGGHATFAPHSRLEAELLLKVFDQYAHVSSERFLSGPGIGLIYSTLASINGVSADKLSAPQIMQRGLEGECALCKQTLEAFCEILGTIAGNLAITLGAKGGIYIGGGIVPRLGRFFSDSGFRRRFEEKGRLSGYMADIPSYVITEPYPALTGMSALIRQALMP